MPHIKSKYFPVLLLLSAVIVEASAVFFSVFGLTKLFAGAAISVGIMAGSLELAKVISVSYLYRYWGELKFLFKTYMTTAVFILMLITSLGIYGFLSNAFQSSTLVLEKDVAKLTLLEQEIVRYKEDNTSLKNEKTELQRILSEELRSLTTADTSRRYADATARRNATQRWQPQIKEKDAQIAENNKKIEQLSQQITDSKVAMIDTGADVGPIIFVSQAFGVGINVVVQWLILLFIVVFDPLALALIIAFNKITMDNNDIESFSDEIVRRSWESHQKNIKNEQKQVIQEEPQINVSPPIVQEEPPVVLSYEGAELTPVHNVVEQEPPKFEPTVVNETSMGIESKLIDSSNEEPVKKRKSSKDEHVNWPKSMQSTSF